MKAANRYAPKNAPSAITAAAPTSSLAAGFGTFSASALSQIGIGGLSQVEKATQETAEGVQELVDIARHGNGLQFV